MDNPPPLLPGNTNHPANGINSLQPGLSLGGQIIDSNISHIAPIPTATDTRPYHRIVRTDSDAVDNNFEDNQDGDIGMKKSTKMRARSNSNPYDIKLKRQLRKNCREKQRRIEIGVQFDVLCRMLGKQGKAEKHAVLSEAIGLITTLRSQNQELKSTQQTLKTELDQLTDCLQQAYPDKPEDRLPGLEGESRAGSPGEQSHGVNSDSDSSTPPSESPVTSHRQVSTTPQSPMSSITSSLSSTMMSTPTNGPCALSGPPTKSSFILGQSYNNPNPSTMFSSDNSAPAPSASFFTSAPSTTQSFFQQ